MTFVMVLLVATWVLCAFTLGAFKGVDLTMKMLISSYINEKLEEKEEAEEENK